jgi:hypothetical protein
VIFKLSETSTTSKDGFRSLTSRRSKEPFSTLETLNGFVRLVHGGFCLWSLERAMIASEEES